jgi:hypothetical protein
LVEDSAGGAQLMRIAFGERLPGASLEVFADGERALEAVGLPATLLLDREGREIGRHLGAVKWDSPEVVEDLRRKIAGE